MIIESVEHGPLIWPMIEENGMIITKKYAELSAIEKIQADFDMKATNIILQGRQNSYAAGNLGTRANTLGTEGNYSRQQRIMKCFKCQGKVIWQDSVQSYRGKGMLHLGIVEGPVTQLVITYNAAYQVDDFDAYGYNCDEISITKAVLMENLSSYGSDFLFEAEIHSGSNIIPYSQYLIESQTATVQDTNSSPQQDALILSMFDNCQIKPMLYDGNVIATETNMISIANSEETLMLEDESRSKMFLKQSDPMVLEKKVNTKPINYVELNRLSKDFGKHFVPHREFSDKQALHLIIDQSASLLVKIEAPWELLKISNATTMAPGMYKLDVIILASQVKNNRETHEYYLKHIMEQAAILREELNKLNHETLKIVNLIQPFRTVPNPPPSSPFVQPLRYQWDLVFQPMFGEFYSPPASVVSLVLIEEAPAPVESTDSPSLTTFNQDAPSPSTSQNTPQTQSQTLPSLEVTHICNDPYFDIQIPETVYEESSSSDVFSTTVHPDALILKHLIKWTKYQPL
nr:hypothetical protein [Tanacetum cinerariifolium]